MHQHTFPAVYLSDWFHIVPQYHIKLSLSCTAEFFLKGKKKKKKAKKPKADLTAEVANQFSWLWSQETAEFPARL